MLDTQGNNTAEHDHVHAELVPATDLSIADRDLSPSDLSRREFLRRLGLLGASLGLASVVQPWRSSRADAAQSDPPAPDTLSWLPGDHHIHTQYSSDARYRVDDQVAHSRQYGLAWMVITDHGREAHEKVAIDRTLTDVLVARQSNPSMLVYQGLEWNIPGAEHGTVFFAPGPHEADLLHFFEKNFDGLVVYGSDASKNSRIQEAKAVEGIRWMEQQVVGGQTAAALFLANHPSRRGLDSPHEIRAWNDASPRVAIGMEGAPGHQAAGIGKASQGPETARGFYDFSPTPDSHKGYPLESYRTFGGFDWMTAKVGGLWDSLLTEGRRWWITANSDSHSVYRDSLVRGAGDGLYDDPKSPYSGAYGDPINTRIAQAGNGDFWPGYYSRTVVGAAGRTYESVMNAISAGRMWVCHGDLIRGLDVRVTAPTSRSKVEATLGDTAVVQRGDQVDLTIKVRLSETANFNGAVPRLRRVDLITGPLGVAATDPDSFSAQGTKVVTSWEVNSTAGEVSLTYRFSGVRDSFYLRLRGTDGNASAPNSIEPRLDPVPIDPWSDLWFYSNPIFVQMAP